MWCKITTTGIFFTILVENKSNNGCSRLNIGSYSVPEDI